MNRFSCGRRGFTLFEILVAVFVLVAAMGLALKTVSAVSQAAARTAARAAAHQEAANTLERLSILPFERLDAAVENPPPPSNAFAKRVTRPRISVAVEEAASAPEGTLARHVVVEVDWKGSRGVPVRLSTWRYAAGPVEEETEPSNAAVEEKPAEEAPPETSEEPAEEGVAKPQAAEPPAEAEPGDKPEEPQP